MEDKTKSDQIEVDIIGSTIQSIKCVQCGFVITNTCKPCPNCGYLDCDS